MQKGGQVSVFVIIGIVAVAAIILMFFLFRSVEEKAREVTDTEQYLQSQINDIKKEVVECISDVSNDLLDRFYKGGGHLNPVRYANYYGNKVGVLCYKVEESESCKNMMFSKADIMQQLIPELERDIPECVEAKLDAFRDKGYDVEVGEFLLDKDKLIFDEDMLLVSINYPIELTKDNFDDIQEEFTVSIDTSFWKIAEIVDEIVNKHARDDILDVASMSTSNVYFEIGRVSYSSGNVYMIKERGADDIFYFAVET